MKAEKITKLYFGDVDYPSLNYILAMLIIQ
jgi:hypothetical protein